jgi:hypothetical protein
MIEQMYSSQKQMILKWTNQGMNRAVGGEKDRAGQNITAQFE